jgi:hypothetical protein
MSSSSLVAIALSGEEGILAAEFGLEELGMAMTEE